VTPSTYIGITALGLVALSGWVVNMENEIYANKAKEMKLRGVARYPRNGDHEPQPPDPAASLAHPRYELLNSDLPQSRATIRQMGSRVEPRLPMLTPAVQSYEVGNLQDLSEIPGPVPVAIPVQPTFESVSTESGYHVNADEADKIGNGSDQIVFTGHVTMTSPTFHMVSDKLIMHMGKDGETFKLAESRGSVKVQLTGGPPEKMYRGQSEVALYNPSKGTLVMTGWPKIQGDGQELIASESSTKVTLYPATGKMNTEGRTQTRVAKKFMEADAKK
jgi:lipopolysaccharide transport protein LptA